LKGVAANWRTSLTDNDPLELEQHRRDLDRRRLQVHQRQFGKRSDRHRPKADLAATLHLNKDCVDPAFLKTGVLRDRRTGQPLRP